MKVLENQSLKEFNTFRIDVSAKYLVELETEEDIQQFLADSRFKNEEIFILGKGSNILLTKNIDSVVLMLTTQGINVIQESDESVLLEIAGGEIWHDLVTYAVEKNYGGVENMALIPGTVAAAAVQNIAAYGENLINVFDSLDAVNLATGETKNFSREECEFSYRESIFKNKLRNKYLVTKARLKLQKNPEVNLNYFETGKTYKAGVSLEGVLGELAKPPYSIKDVYNAVIHIRKQKLPDPAEIGTAGSFFKNPVIKRSDYEKLKETDPDLQCYPVEALAYPKLNDANLTHADYVKVPAGRLLDNLGWKGKRRGDVGTYPYQALAVVNYGNASVNDVLGFIQAMQQDVKKRYGIDLVPEVQII